MTTQTNHTYEVLLHPDISGVTHIWSNRHWTDQFVQLFNGETLRKQIDWYENTWRNHQENIINQPGWRDVPDDKLPGEIDCLTYMCDRWNRLPFNPFQNFGHETWRDAKLRPRMTYTIPGDENTYERPRSTYLAIDFMTDPEYTSEDNETGYNNTWPHPASWGLVGCEGEFSSPRRLIDGVADYIENTFSDRWTLAIQSRAVSRQTARRHLGFQESQRLCHEYRSIYLHYCQVYRDVLNQIRIWCCG